METEAQIQKAQANVTSRFYTALDFDVHFSKHVPPGWSYRYLKGQLIAKSKIGEPCDDEGWDEVRFNPADRWVCEDTPQARRART